MDYWGANSAPFHNDLDIRNEIKNKEHIMRNKPTLALLLPFFLLAGCSGADNSESDSLDSSSPTSSASSSSVPSSSSVDEDDRVMNRDDGTALEYKDVANPYVKGSATNSDSIDYENIYVNQPTNALAKDFAFGVDCSSLYEVERHGGKFYDEEGKEEDLFVILKNGGANYARFRLWVDPYDKDGNSYGGGSNDISTDIYLAKRAANAGLKILINFHYSDSWADPAKQWAPKAWMNLSSTGKPTINARTQYKRVGDYTGHALNAFKEAGITVNAVQIGNETNYGMAGATSAVSKYFADMVASGVATAKSVFPDVKTIVHLTNVSSPDSAYSVYNNLKNRGTDWDVCGLSYYPYWHGSRENLQKVMNKCAEEYGKEVMIVETSWGYTDEGVAFSNNQFSSSKFGKAGGYVTSPQGQATELSDLVDCLSKVPDQKGTGIFYWEPAWLPLEGAGWISKCGAYYNDYGVDASSAADLSTYSDSYCYSSWANQALFNYQGRALPSYSTYKHIVDGDKTIEIEAKDLLESEFEATYNLSDSTSSIPTTGMVITNVGSYLTEEIVWDEADLAVLESVTQGQHYTVNGKLHGLDVTCDVLVYNNFIQDYSFENQNTLQGNKANEYAVTSPWNLVTTANGVRVETKSEGNRTGTHYFHWYSDGSYSFTLSQALSDVPAGTYVLKTYVIANTPDDTTTGGYSKANLFYQIGDGEKVTVSMLSKLKGWNAGLVEWSIPSIVVSDISDVTIGMEVEAGYKSWGHNDDWSFVLAI